MKEGADSILSNLFNRMKKQGPLIFDILVSVAVVAVTTWSSGQTAEVSGGASKGIVRWLLSCLPGVYTEATISFLDHLLRKAAHFTLYFILGCSLTGCYRRQRRVPYVLAVLVTGFVLAGLDEFHQMFVDGRGPQFSDVILDTCGVATGCLVATVFHRLWQKHVKKRNN